MFSIEIVRDNKVFEDKLINKILENNPSLHAFTLHDIRNDRERSELYIAYSTIDYCILGYILVYKGLGRYYSIIIESFNEDNYNIIRKLIDYANITSDITGTIHINEKYLDIIIENIKTSSVYFYYIMEYTGNPPTCSYGYYNIVELDYKSLKNYEASYEIIRRVKGLRRAYGVVLGNRVVGVGGFYVAEPEVYLVGGIYVEPEYRGRGIGKAISCFLTRKALEHTSRVVLWVNVDNKPAVRIYTSIGYSVLRVNAWVNVNVNLKP